MAVQHITVTILDNDDDHDESICLVSAVGYTEVTSQARVLSEHQLSAQTMIIIIVTTNIASKVAQSPSL